MRGTFNGKQGASPLSATRPVILASLLLSTLVGCNSLPSESQGSSLATGVYGTIDAATITSGSMQGLDVVAQPTEVTAGGYADLSATVQLRSTKTDSRTRVRTAATITTWSTVSADALVQLTARAGTISGSRFTPPTTAGTYWVVGQIVSEGLVDSVSVTVLPSAQPVAVAISPRQPALSPTAQQQFAVTARWADAVVRAYTVSYSATGGTISSTGLYTAGSTPGTYRVIGACSCGGADTATVTITAPATLSAITMLPNQVTVGAGATQQFTVTASKSDGSPTTVPALTYSASAGSVSAGGLYTAPAAPGVYRVVATASGGAFADTSFVTVTTIVPFFSDNFDNGARTNANGFQWGSASDRVKVGTELKNSGTHSLIFTYGPNAPGQDSWAEQRFVLGSYVSELYIEYYLYAPANYVHRNDAPGNNKFLALWRDVYEDFNGGTWRVLFEYQRTTLDGPDNFSGFRFAPSRWDMRYETDQGLEGVQGQYAPFMGGNGVVRLGAWNRIRFQIKTASSRTASDGIAKMWVNDSLVLNYTQGRFHNFFDSPGDALIKNGYFLGWSNSGYAQTTVFAIDDVKFYSANPGW